jgi:ribosomal protein S27E
MSNKIELPIDEIVKLYTINKMTATDIAKQFNVNICTILNRLKIAGIPQKYDHVNHNPNSAHKIYVNPEELQKLYIEEHLTSVETAKRLGITFTTVLNKLREYNIKVRDEHDYIENRIDISKIPKIITNVEYTENGTLIGYVACPLCNKTRKLTLSTLRINEITNRNGRCNRCAMKSRTIKLDIKLIKHLYENERWTTYKIGDYFGVSGHTILKHMNLNNIKVDKKGFTYDKHQPRKVIQNKGTLENPILGDICRGTDIDTRNDSYYLYVECPKCHKTRWQEKSKAKKYGTLCYFCATSPTVNNRGTIEHPTIGDIQYGKNLGKNDGSCYVWIECPECHNARWTPLHHAKKHPRCKDCATKINGLNHRGEKAFGWQGGYSFEGYPTEWNEKLKKWIRSRDNHKCQLCNQPQNGIALAVHHIDYNKKNIHPNNLISLCTQQKDSNGCHVKTNHNRNYWTSYFTRLLKTKGLYITKKNQFILPL